MFLIALYVMFTINIQNLMFLMIEFVNPQINLPNFIVNCKNTIFPLCTLIMTGAQVLSFSILIIVLFFL